MASAVGTVMALFGFSLYFIEFLNVLGVFSTSIAAIYILDFFWLRKQNYDSNQISEWGTAALISWGIATIISLCTYLDIFQLTGAYYIDSLLIAGLCYSALEMIQKNKDRIPS